MCASVIQDRVRSNNRNHPESTLWLRVGVDVEASGDPEPGALARRLCRSARAGQALASSRLRESVEGDSVGFAPVSAVADRELPAEAVAEIVGAGGSGVAVPRAPDVLLSRLVPPRPPRPRLTMQA